jgi:hypothetical protein
MVDLKMGGVSEISIYDKWEKQKTAIPVIRIAVFTLKKGYLLCGFFRCVEGFSGSIHNSQSQQQECAAANRRATLLSANSGIVTGCWRPAAVGMRRGLCPGV